MAEARRFARIDHFLIAGVFLAAVVPAPRVAAGAQPRVALRTDTRPVLSDSRPDSAHARELVLVLIGAQQCAAHRNPVLAERYRLLCDRIRRDAAAEGRRFRTIGIAVDAEPDDGISFLRQYGPFDQAIVGGGWSNEGAVRFLWKDHRGEPSIPQLVIVRRELTLLPEVRITEEVVARRAVGVRAILAAAADPEGYTSPGSWLRIALSASAPNVSRGR